jgi:hypothetical protein
MGKLLPRFKEAVWSLALAVRHYVPATINP